MSQTSAPTPTKITRDDIEAKLREIQGEVDETAESAKGMAVAIGAAVAVTVVVAVFLLGRRRGKRKMTIVEVRRF
jgi:multidrug efflux pump subunit AcrB